MKAKYFFLIPLKLFFENEANILIKQLQSYSVIDLKKIMKISDNLSKLNYDRFQNFDLNSEDSAPAVLLLREMFIRDYKQIIFQKIL